MPEVFFNGPAGRLEGRFHPAKQRGAPIAVVLHPHPQFGGTMNNQIVYSTYYSFAERGFSVANLTYRLIDAGQRFEYRMTLRTHDAANAGALSEELKRLDTVSEFRISPAGD